MSIRINNGFSFYYQPSIGLQHHTGQTQHNKQSKSVPAVAAPNGINAKTDTFSFSYCASPETSPADNLSASVPAALPETYNSLKQVYIYYKGERISEYDLIQEAVSNGAITLKTNETPGWNSLAAWNALIQKKAAPLYDWSTTLYSEDGMYVMRRGKNGEIDGYSLAVSPNGTHVREIAAKIAGGVKLCDMDAVDLAFLRQVDPELCAAATEIGTAVRGFHQLSDMARSGELTPDQFAHDCRAVYILLFGDPRHLSDADLVQTLEAFFSRDAATYLNEAFENYNPKNSGWLTEFQKSGFRSFSGLF